MSQCTTGFEMIWLVTDRIRPLIKSQWGQSSCVNSSSLSFISYSAGQYFSCWNKWSIWISCLGLITFQCRSLTSFSLWGKKKEQIDSWCRAGAHSLKYISLIHLRHNLQICFYFSLSQCRISHKNCMCSLSLSETFFTFVPTSRTRRWIDWAFLLSLTDWLLLAGHDLHLLLFCVEQTNQPFECHHIISLSHVPSQAVNS